MAFRASPSPFPGLAMNTGNVQTNTGPDLEEIQTEAIGFQALAGEAKLRLLPSPWPAQSLPPPTASLLSIASKTGLVAAAGPDSVVVAGTESVRQALSAPADSKIKPFTPQLTLPLGMRVSQVAFSADENFLVLSAENGGGLAVYDVQSLMQGSTQTAFELATNGTSLRALAPNPTSEKAELFAAVSTNGDLMIADLKARQFVMGSQGQTLKAGVSYVSWSNKGRQLVAGLGDGSLYPMTPEGEGKGDIPKPSGLDGDQFVSSISWLENDVFIVAHTPTTLSDGMIPATTYHVITRFPKHSPPSITYQKLPETSPAFGLERVPSFQFMQRLRNFPPNLEDVIVVASTASIDIGLITKSKTALSDEVPAEKISNVYTTTTMAEDSRRAQMPMAEDLSDTSPIGLGFDLSSKDKVQRPLPAEEYDASQGPLPALMALNNEGILSVWWFVYAESIRQGTTFPGLVAAGGLQGHQQPQSERQVSPFANSSLQASTGVGQSSFGNPSIPAKSSFAGAFSQPSAFGQAPSLGSAFGSPSALGKASTPFGGPVTTSQSQGLAFGQSSFGSPASTSMGPTTQGTAFGMAGGLGNRSSPWGAPSGGTAASIGAAFGKSGFDAPKASPFGAPTTSNTSTSTAGAFTSFASNSSPFMTATPNSGGESLFNKAAPAPAFGSGMDTDTSFGGGSKKDAQASQPSFASGAFTLGSTFKPDGSASSDAPKPATSTGHSMFGGGFGDALNGAQEDAALLQTKDADMDDEEDSAPINKSQQPTTPAAMPAPPKFNFPVESAPPIAGGLFGTQAQSKTTPAAVGSSQPTGFTIDTFGKPSPLTTTPNDTPRKVDEPRPSIEASPKIKEEPLSDDGGEISPLNEQEAAPPLGYRTPETPPMSKNTEPPLPPESTSKASFAPGDSSNSSKSSDDAPMPPDFLPSKTKLKEVEAALPEEARLPSGDDGKESGELTDNGSSEEEGTDEDNRNFDDEGSGVDVAQEISPTTDPNQSPKITPGSSFGAPPEKSPQRGLFGSDTPPTQDRQKVKPPLFGEVGKTSAPYLPPPTKTQQSPRSPSPVRLNALGNSLRPDNARSISAPGPFQALNNRKATLTKVTVPSKLQPSSEKMRKEAQEQMLAEERRKRVEEEQDLSDREDEKVREELATEVEGTKHLDPFLAHQNYTGNIHKEGIPGQIEKVYRDINSMIDTLGINARSLKAFMKGHQELHKPNGRRTRDDLENDDWCLIEIADLPKVEDDLFEKLENGQVQDFRDKVDECRDLRKEVATLRNKAADIGRTIDTHSQPDEVESARTAPLSLDQAIRQQDLRKKMTRFQKLLTEAEENITMLRTKLASCNTSNGKDPPMRKPTVEAVTNTIMKMTKIVEKKDADIEILENQLQNLRFSSVASQSSREGSPLNPASSRRKAASRLGSSMNGRHQTPSRASILGHSTNGQGTSRKGASELSQEEVQKYREKVRRRQEINAIIKETFEKDGPRIRGLE